VLIRRYQHEPVRHDVVAEGDDASRANHRFENVAQSDRVAACTAIVSEERSSIVFVRTKHGADRLARQLTVSGVRAAAIHGGRSQAQRDRALASFRSGHVQALVATDVAARGIHVDAVACVVNFDLPADSKDYVHRSGRTARAGADGSVVTLVTPEQVPAAAALHRALDIEISGAPTDRPRSRPVAPVGRARRHPRQQSGGGSRGSAPSRHRSRGAGSSA
jgi:superfamily II DNA/RNA helicase